MSDDTFFARLRESVAELRNAEPQARDEEPIAISREEHSQEPDREDIERWINEYYNNPLIRQSVRNFAGDVLEPGVAVSVDTPDDGDEPTVPQDYKFEEFRGLDLSEALALWLKQVAIVGGRFDRDMADLLEDVVIDLRGRRGTSLVEHAYKDPTERDYILGLRTFKVETVTAYTRSGKNILLKPDDAPDAYETIAIQESSANRLQDGAPDTPAGKTAAIVQFDDIFGRHDEKDDIPFALDDVTIISNDPDTGAIFGKPDAASVVDESESVREMFEDTAQAIKTVGYGHWIATVDTNDEDEAKKLLDGFDPSDPERVNVTNYGVDTEHFEGQSPDNVEHIQQLIEYILTSLPTPLYRVGFGGDINRDVTSVQQDDYQQEIQRERDRLQSAFSELLDQKVAEFMEGDAKADTEYGADLVIEPEDEDSPLLDENFDADEFSSVMSGLKQAAPGGAVEQVVPPHEVRETFLGLDAEAPEAPDADAAAMEPLPDETDPDVQETFREAYLGNRYRAGDDMVETPDGVGLVVEAITSSREIDAEDAEEIPETVEASTDSPTYVVAVPTSDPPVGLYKASDLSMADLSADVDALGSLAEDEAAAAALADCGCGEHEAQLADWSPPQSWRDADVPARVIALDAFSSMGGDFDGCKREMSGEVGRPANFCGAFMDYVFGGYDYWRGDSFLPGE